MAVTISKVSVATPTNFTATVSAGGSLPDNTYYYRVISFRSYNATMIYSAASAEISATTSGTNNTVDLAWDAMANADGYLLQRSTTSGSYPPFKQNSWVEISKNNQDPCAVVQNSFVDDGGSGYAWTGYNRDFSIEHPTIEVYSNVNDYIKMNQVYDADVAGGWNVLNMMAPTDIQATTLTAVKDSIGYWLHGNIYVHDCQFQLPSFLYVIGGFRTVDTVTITNDPYNKPAIYMTAQFQQYKYNNDLTYVGYKFQDQSLHGTSSSVVNNLVRRRLSLVYRPFVNALWDSGTGNYSGGGTYNRCILGDTAANGMPIFDATYNDCIWESMRFYSQGVSNANVWSGSPSFRWSSTKKVTGMKTFESAWYDLEVQSTTNSIMVIDPEFGATSSSTQLNPYINQIVFASSDGLATNISHTIKLKIVDVNGNAIQGATIKIDDKLDNNALWESTTARINGSLDLTSTSLTLTDTSVLSVGDYIRFELNQEIIKIVSIDTSTTATVLRGQLGTQAEYHSGNNSTSQYNYCLRNVSSLTTDANGEATPDYPLISRHLIVRYLGSYQRDYEDNLVTLGAIERYYYSPHTITITKTGYVTKKISLVMDRKREEVITLENRREV